MHKKIYKWCARAGLAGLLLTAGASLNAETIASVKAMGMGGAAVAYGQDAITSFYNPATAVTVDTRADAGIGGLWKNGEVRISEHTNPALSVGTFHTEDNWRVWGEVGVNYRLGCCDEFAVGAQWNNYDSIYTQYGAPIVDFSGIISPQKPSFDYRTEVLTFTGAYQLCNGHAFGVGLNVYFSWLDIKGLGAFASSPFSVDPGRFTNKGSDESTGVGVTLGWLGSFCDDAVKLGFTYSPRVHMDKFDDYRGLLAGGHSLDIPETFRLGASYNLCDAVVFAGDWEFRRYSRIKAWANPFWGDGDDIGGLFGTSNGPGFGWEDQWILKLGVETAVNDCLVARFGFRHEESPIRTRGGTDTVLNALTLDVVQNFLTAGLTYHLTPCSEISTYVEYGCMNHARANWPSIDDGETELINPGKLRFEQTTASFGIAYGQRF